MKLSNLLFSALVFVIASSCSSDTGKFEGVWQSVNDPSKQIIFTSIGKSITFETRNMTSPIQGLPGTYNAEENTLVFEEGNGAISTLAYIDSTQHILGLGDEFERATSVEQNKNEAQEAVEDQPESAPAENSPASTSKSSCDKGDILVISGNNVRVRNEPDVTKQNILFQVHKGYEVVHLDDKSVDGQKWYKVCYDGNIGWVSGEYAAKK